MKRRVGTYGYYQVSITSQGGKSLMRSNSERAFTIAQLQDLLSPRLILVEIPAHKQLASCIDLLAFSITNHSIDLLFFSIDKSIAVYLANCVAERVGEYHQELYPVKTPLAPRICIQKLTGPHQALARSLDIHLQHEDWEYDRYSSVGFYLHDRRGDWMRTWRLAQLYENNSANYYHLLIEKVQPADLSSTALLQTVGP